MLNGNRKGKGSIHEIRQKPQQMIWHCRKHQKAATDDTWELAAVQVITSLIIH